MTLLWASDFHHPTPLLEQSTPPLNRGSTPWSHSHFWLPSRRLDSFFFWSPLFDIRGSRRGLTPLFNIRGFTNLLAWLSLEEAWLLFLLESFVRHSRIYQSIGMTKFRALLWYHVRRTRLSTMLWYCLLWGLSSHSFALGFPKRPHTNGECILCL